MPTPSPTIATAQRMPAIQRNAWPWPWLREWGPSRRAVPRLCSSRTVRRPVSVLSLWAFSLAATVFPFPSGARRSGLKATPILVDLVSYAGGHDFRFRRRPQLGRRRGPDAERPRALPHGWNAVGKGSDDVGTIEDDGTVTPAPVDEPVGLSTPMLLLVGVVGGVYLLYTIGWIVGGLRLQPLASFLVSDVMFLPWFVLAIAAPALWFLASWVLTRGEGGVDPRRRAARGSRAARSLALRHCGG